MVLIYQVVVVPFTLIYLNFFLAYPSSVNCLLRDKLVLVQPNNVITSFYFIIG